SEIKNMYIESHGGFTIEKYDNKYPLTEHDYHIYELVKNKSINKADLKVLTKMKIGYISN
ncbi:hypothetical protein, partial [Mammaliicoccus vitulinus]|uniref:hypothetical protein n=1 Tax=Mammaliicoccus vitulinus TaxID=71237 RepID=UPI001A7E135C